MSGIAIWEMLAEMIGNTVNVYIKRVVPVDSTSPCFRYLFMTKLTRVDAQELLRLRFAAG